MLLSLASLAGCGADETVHEDLASLVAALGEAEPGDEVRLGAVTLTATEPIVVPAGVTLVGAGEGASRIVGPPDDVALVLRTAAGAAESAVTDLTVESDGRAAFMIGGGGDGRIERCSATVTRGVGLGAEDIGRLSLDGVSLVGPVTPENADAQPLDPAPNDTATHGVVLVRVANANFVDVSVVGFAELGATALDSGLEWVGGAADRNLGAGVFVTGGSARLVDLSVSGTLQGLRLLPAYGVIVTGGADVSSERLGIHDGASMGLVHAGVGGAHRDLAASGNRHAAVWVQDADGFELTGAGTLLEDNSFAGLVGIMSTGVTFTDGTVSGTVEAPRLQCGPGCEVRVGDGLHWVGTTGAVGRVTLRSNERAGAVFDLDGGTTEALALTSITADATGDSLGLVAQNGTREDGWDTGVTRGGAAGDNDTAFLAAGDALDVAGIVGPPDLRREGELATEGLESLGIVGPPD